MKNFAKNENTSVSLLELIAFSESSIDLLIQAFTVTNDWGEYLKNKRKS